MPKRILVLGATSPTGIFTVRELLSAGHTTTLFIRNPSKLPADIASHPAVKVLTGSITSKEDLDPAFEDVDAVISLLGPTLTRPWAITHAWADAQPILVELMRKHGIRKILTMGSLSTTDERDASSFVRSAMVWVVYLVYRNVWKDVIRTQRFFEGIDDLEWTIFRLPLLSEEPGDVFESASLDGLHAGYIGDGRTTMATKRGPLGKWLAQEATREDSEWVRKRPVLSDVAIAKKDL